MTGNLYFNHFANQKQVHMGIHFRDAIVMLNILATEKGANTYILPKEDIEIDQHSVFSTRLIYKGIDFGDSCSDVDKKSVLACLAGQICYGSLSDRKRHLLAARIETIQRDISYLTEQGRLMLFRKIINRLLRNDDLSLPFSINSSGFKTSSSVEFDVSCDWNLMLYKLSKNRKSYLIDIMFDQIKRCLKGHRSAVRKREIRMFPHFFFIKDDGKMRKVTGYDIPLICCTNKRRIILGNLEVSS